MSLKEKARSSSSQATIVMVLSNGMLSKGDMEFMLGPFQSGGSPQAFNISLNHAPSQASNSIFINKGLFHRDTFFVLLHDTRF